MLIPTSLRSAACATLAVCAVAGPAVATAHAAIDPIYLDCADDRVDGHYASAQLRHALDGMPADLDEYSTCREAIEAALTHTAPVPGSDTFHRNVSDPGTRNVSDPGTRNVSDPGRGGAAAVPDRAGAQRALPVVRAAAVSAPGGDVPGPVLFVVGVLTVAGVGGTFFALRRLRKG